MSLTRALKALLGAAFCLSVPLHAAAAGSLHPFHDSAPDPGVTRAEAEMEGPQMLDCGLSSAMTAARAHELDGISRAQALALGGLGLMLGLAWWQDRHWHRQQRAQAAPLPRRPAGRDEAEAVPLRADSAKALHEQFHKAYRGI